VLAGDPAGAVGPLRAVPGVDRVPQKRGFSLKYGRIFVGDLIGSARSWRRCVDT